MPEFESKLPEADAEVEGGGGWPGVEVFFKQKIMTIIICLMYLPPGGQGITSSRRGSAGKRRRRRPGSATRTSETSDLRGLKLQFSILFIFES